MPTRRSLDSPGEAGKPQPVSMGFLGRVLTVAAVVVGLLFLWRIVDALLLIFAGLLLAILLNRPAVALARRTPLSERTGTMVALLVLIGLLVGTGWLIGGQVSSAFSDLLGRLPAAFERAMTWIENRAWARSLLQQAEGSIGGGTARDLLARTGSALTLTLEALSALAVVIFAAIFLAIDPGLYRSGLLRLVPPRHEHRAAEILDATSGALWNWLVGQLISMTIVGVVTTAGLLLLGVPAAVALGILAALLEFVPYIGSIIAAVPAILIALTAGPQTALWVVFLYVAIQQLEGNIVMPLVQRKMVSLPPVLTLGAIVAAGIVLGPVGLFLATPLTVVAMVWTRMIYVEDILGRTGGDGKD